MLEKRKRYCLYCKEQKDWLQTNKKLSDGTKVYVDKNGFRWAGKRCPQCEKKRVQYLIKYNSFERELILKKLKDEGYQVQNKIAPFEVIKDANSFTIDIQKASVEAGEISFSDMSCLEADHLIVLFQSARILTKAQVMDLFSQKRKLSQKEKI